MNLRSRNKVSVEFNMSSMTDMIFLLLIFFMILSTKVAENNVMRVDLPKGSSGESSTVGVRVSVDKDLNYYVGQKQIPFEAIEAELQAKLAGVPDAKVEIAVDKTNEYDVFVKLVDLVYVKNGWKPIIVTDRNGK